MPVIRRGRRTIPAVFFLSVFLSEALGAGTSELVSSLDGGGRIAAGLLYRETGLSLGMNARWDPDGGMTAMASFNGPWFAFGALGDSGLAAEMRNPGSEATARLAEETRYAADIRSLSSSRLGLALYTNDKKTSLCFESRGGMPFALVRTTPLDTAGMNLEAAMQLSFLEPSEEPGEWYPDEYGFPGGFGMIPALRFRWMPGDFSGGVTLMSSLGSRLVPGGAGAISCRWASGPWLLDGRAAMASRYFRNADFELPDEFLGGRMRLRRRPSKGMRLLVDSRISEMHSGGISSVVDVEVGWQGADGRWRMDTGMGWRIPIPEPGCLSALIPGDASLGILLSHSSWQVRLDGKWSQSDGWSAGVSTEIRPSASEIRFRWSGTIRFTSESIAFDTNLRLTVPLKANTLIVSCIAEDIPDSWSPLPDGIGDFDFSVRWIFPLSDSWKSNQNQTEP